MPNISQHLIVEGSKYIVLNFQAYGFDQAENPRVSLVPPFWASAPRLELQPWTHQHRLTAANNTKKWEFSKVGVPKTIGLLKLSTVMNGMIWGLRPFQEPTKMDVTSWGNWWWSVRFAPFSPIPPRQWVGCWGQRSASGWWDSWPLAVLT